MNGYLAQIAARVMPITAIMPLVQPSVANPQVGAEGGTAPDPFTNLPPAQAQDAPTDDLRPAAEPSVSPLLHTLASPSQASPWLAPAYLGKHIGRTGYPVIQVAAQPSTPSGGAAIKEGVSTSKHGNDLVNRYSPDEARLDNLPSLTPSPVSSQPVSRESHPHNLTASSELLRPVASALVPSGSESAGNVPASALLPPAQAEASTGTLPLLLPPEAMPQAASQAPAAPLISIGRISVEVILPAPPSVAPPPRRPASPRPAPAGDPFKLSFGFGQL